jgi:hypothetical protein
VTRIAALKAGRTVAPAAGAAPPSSPLVLLAHGDSWFDYPLNGDSVSLSRTDIVAQLENMGTINPVIQNVSHYGDATTEEMSWPKQERMIQRLQDSSNWLNSGFGLHFSQFGKALGTRKSQKQFRVRSKSKIEDLDKERYSWITEGKRWKRCRMSKS